MTLDDLLADMHAKAGSADLPLIGTVNLGELSEHQLARSVVNADAAVFHRYPHLPAVVLHRNRDTFALGRELQRIRQQIGHHLHQSRLVTIDESVVFGESAFNSDP